MDMQIVVFYRLLDLFAQQVSSTNGLVVSLENFIIMPAGVSAFIIGILAGDVVGFDIDDLQEHIACLGFAGVLRWLR